MIKNKNWLIIILVVIGIFGFILKPNNKDTLQNNSLLPTKPKKQFAIWVEQTIGKGDFKEQDSFPGPGYKLGKDTKCVDNTGAVVDNSTVMNSDGSVTVTSSSTTYCTLYFVITKCSDTTPSILQDIYTSDTTLLGSTEDNNDGYLIYHDGLGDYKNSEYEAEDCSYRYSGNNPDNYVCMDGSSSTGTCDPSKLYRIIGFFPEDPENPKTSPYQIKLIKSEYLTYEETEENLNIDKIPKSDSPSGWTPRVNNQSSVNGFYWSGSKSITWNDWLSSDLNKGLNKEDGVYLQSLQPYIDAKLINDTTWYIGGNDVDKIYKQSNMKLAYDNELGSGKLASKTGTEKCTNNSQTFVDCTDELLYQTSKVGLMYVTEYGYASVPTNWSNQLYNYDDTGNKNKDNNWLFNGVFELTLTRCADSSDCVYRVHYGGYTDNTLFLTMVGAVYNNTCGVRPVLVLTSAAEIQNGEGTKLSPWRIKLPEQS